MNAWKPTYTRAEIAAFLIQAAAVTMAAVLLLAVMLL